MAFKFSQGMVKAMANRRNVKVVMGTDVALVDGGAGSDTITRTAADFLMEGFKPGDAIYVMNATDSSDDIEGVTCTDVAAGTITLPTGTFTTGETAGADIAVIAADGGSLAGLFNGGQLTVFSGTRPSNAHDAISGNTALIEFDDIVFGEAQYDSTNGYAYIDLSATVSSTAIAAGTGTWCRLVAAGHDRDGASTTAVRIDGTVGTTGDLVVTNTSFSVGQTESLVACKLKLAIS